MEKLAQEVRQLREEVVVLRQELEVSRKCCAGSGEDNSVQPKVPNIRSMVVGQPKTEMDEELAAIWLNLETTKRTTGSSSNAYISPGKKEAYQKLRRRLMEIADKKVAVTGASRRRFNEEMQDIVACMGMVLVMEESKICNLVKLMGGLDASPLHYFNDRARQIFDDFLEQPVRPKHNDAIGQPEETADGQKSVRTWYDETCIVTGRSTAEAYPIMPDCVLRYRERRARFLASIFFFWPQESKKLKSLLDEPHAEKTNFLVLDKDIHGAWTHGAFGLCPIGLEGDPTTMLLQFEHFPSESPVEWTRYKPRKVQSGDVIRLTTRDPGEYPLPSARLLKLRWRINCALWAASQVDVLRLLFRQDGDSPRISVPGDETEEEEKKTGCFGRPCPSFAQYLIDRALEERVIQSQDVPLWRERLIATDLDTPSQSSSSSSSTGE